MNVTVLVRDEDRHFGEQRVASTLRKRLSDGGPIPFDESYFDSRGATRKCSVTVNLQKFDRLRGSSAEPPSHPEQLRILANTDVLIAAHGAGLAAVVAMRPGTTVIELFPHNFRYYMYEELARVAGVDYVAFESPIVHPPRCCSARGSDVMPYIRKPSDGNGVGARACKKCDILITDDELTELVVHGLASAAYRLHL